MESKSKMISILSDHFVDLIDKQKPNIRKAWIRSMLVHGSEWKPFSQMTEKQLYKIYVEEGLEKSRRDTSGLFSEYELGYEDYQ